ncbi:MAG: RnfABCDGE type electron transport complex subunit D, partial [Lentisphaeria bacterium]|nr:RnfABCDGE type electron transport complex subunit D [Lentisphaeria bacterium]
SGAMTQYAAPRSVFFAPAADALTSATPLSMAESAAGMGRSLEYFNSSDFLWRAFIGETAGSLGETSVLAVLIGGIGLVALRLIRWQIPVSILAAVAIFVSLVNYFSPGTTPGVLFHFFTGGLMLGAFFMATDMVTSPVTIKGGIVFGAGIGILICVIRIYGAYPEGVSFAIVLMNALVPLIDKFCYIKPFGHQNIKAGRIEPRRGEIK